MAWILQGGWSIGYCLCKSYLFLRLGLGLTQFQPYITLKCLCKMLTNLCSSVNSQLYRFGL